MALARLRLLVERAGWIPVRILDEEKMAWAASVHHPVAVLLIAGDEDWTARTVRNIRAATGCVLVVLGKLDALRTVHVLAAGADSVAAHDAPEAELLARLFALVRREPGGTFDETTRYLQGGGLTLDLRNREVTRAGSTIRLTSTEFKLLLHLMQNPGRTVPNRTIIGEVWGGGVSEGINTLRIFIQRLRRKLADPARAPQLISCIRGHGYQFVPSVMELGAPGQGDAAATEQGQALGAVQKLAGSLAGCSDVQAISDTFVRFLVEGATIDGVAVHRKINQRLVLQAQCGLSSDWVRHAADLPITAGLASGAALQASSELVFIPRGPRRYRVTARLLQDEGVSSTLFLPYDFGPHTVGCIGVTRRTADPWNPGPLSVLRTFTALYASQTAARLA